MPGRRRQRNKSRAGRTGLFDELDTVGAKAAAALHRGHFRSVSAVRVHSRELSDAELGSLASDSKLPDLHALSARGESPRREVHV